MLQRILRAIAYLYGAYLLIVLLLVLPAMNFLAPRYFKEFTDRELRSEILLFNPFTLAVDLRGLSVHEQDGHAPISVRRILVDLSISSLWQPGVVLDRAWVRELDVHLLRYEDGRFHFDDLLGSEAEADTDDAPTALPAFTVRDLLFEAHTLRYTDRTRPGPYETVQRDLNLRTDNLTTVPDRSGDGRLVLTSDGGGSLAWSGIVDLAAAQSRGRLELTNIDLTPAWRYEAQSLDFAMNSSFVDLSFDYDANWSGATEAHVRDGVFRLHDVDITAADAQRYPDTGITLGDLTLDGIALDLADQTVLMNSLVVTELVVSGFDEGEVLSLRDIFVDPEASDPQAAGEEPFEADTAEASDSGDTSPEEWSLGLASFSLDDSRVEWATPYLSPEKMVVSPLRVTASNIAWPAEKASEVGLALAINEQTRLSVDGDVHLATGVGTLNTELAEWQLAWLHPVLHEQVRTDLERGVFNLNAAVTLSDFAPEEVRLDASVIDLGTVLHETGQEAFSLERFDVQGVRVQVPEEVARISKLILQSPRGSLHILEDGSINVNGIVRSGPSAEEEAEVPEAEDTGWRVMIDSAVLADGRLDFADDSLPLPFKTMIEGVEAEVVDVDSAAETPLQVTLNGNVDGYAPVIIEGSGTPHAEESDGEMRFRFRGVDIATMSPYSGTYAGYTIASGTLSLDLRYALAGATIDGDNRIVISQMELGEPVSSDLAVEVPLKLGLALLTDTNGVIDLSVPVSGNVDDPEFSLGQVIGRAVMNVITKAVTAPFRLLAGLVGSDADLENVAFAAGSAQLDTAGEDALVTLAEALNQRPQLALRVIGSADPEKDGAALRETILTQSLVEEGLALASIEARDTAWAESVAARYAALPPEPGAEPGSEADGAQPPAQEEPSLEEQWRGLIDATELPAGALQDLGTERAATAKRELVTIGGIDAARIAISFSSEETASGVHMEVDA